MKINHKSYAKYSITLLHIHYFIQMSTIDAKMYTFQKNGEKNIHI